MMTKAEWEKHKHKPIWVDSNSMAEWGRQVCTLVDALFEYRERTKGFYTQILEHPSGDEIPVMAPIVNLYDMKKHVPMSMPYRCCDDIARELGLE